MRSIAILIFPGVQALDVAGPLDVLSEANGFIDASKRYQVTLVGPNLSPFRASNGMLLAADDTYEQTDGNFDLALVAGGPSLPSMMSDDGIVGCIRRLAISSREYGSICTGAFALGHAGLLDGMQATTHWQNAGALAAMFPQARINLDRIYIRDGRMVTSAGVTAGIDLALSIVTEHHGSEVAVATAKRLVVVAQRLGGQSQYSPFLAVAPESDSPIAHASAHVMNNLRDRLSVSDLANTAGMSARNFARAFVQHVGATPAEFVELARIDAARNLLEAGDHALKTIAFECGFGTPRRMRQAFVKKIGVSPLQYRESFSKTLK